MYAKFVICSRFPHSIRATHPLKISLLYQFNVDGRYCNTKCRRKVQDLYNLYNSILSIALNLKIQL
jgi:hypothetical protein